MKEIIESLGAVSELWRNPEDPLREETIQALQVSTGLNRRQIELALQNCFRELTVPKMTAYIASFEQVERSNIDVLHILPSNAFTAWVHGATIILLFGSRCVLKPSRREPVFARAWKMSLEQVDSKLAQRVEISALPDSWLLKCRVVVAYGSDETLQKIRSIIPADVRFAGYGHKLSVGIIFEEALNEGLSDELLERVRQDAEPVRLQGCLSPQILYVESPHPLRWPALEASVDAAPKIKPFTEWENLRQELAKFSPYLSCVGFAGAPEKQEFLENELRDLQVSRVCPLGEMQRPPLSWRNGGIFIPDLLH
jgi:hypothetical protein